MMLNLRGTERVFIYCPSFPRSHEQRENDTLVFRIAPRIPGNGQHDPFARQHGSCKSWDCLIESSGMILGEGIIPAGLGLLTAT
jgi:hypothetical protein